MSFSSWWPGLITLKNWFACNRKYVGESWLFAKIICTRPEMVSEQFSWIRGNNFDYCTQSSPYCIWLSSPVWYHSIPIKMPLFKYGGEGLSADISRKKVCSVFGMDLSSVHFCDISTKIYDKSGFSGFKIFISSRCISFSDQDWAKLKHFWTSYHTHYCSHLSQSFYWPQI